MTLMGSHDPMLVAVSVLIAHDGVLDSGIEMLPKPFTVPELAQRVRALITEAPLP